MKNRYFALQNSFDTYYYRIENDKAFNLKIGDKNSFDKISNVYFGQLTLKEMNLRVSNEIPITIVNMLYPIYSNKRFFEMDETEIHNSIETAGNVCQLIDDPNGEIINADLVGSVSDEMIIYIRSKSESYDFDYRGTYGIYRGIFNFFMNYKQYNKNKNLESLVLLFDDDIICQNLNREVIDETTSTRSNINGIVETILLEKHPILCNATMEDLKNIIFLVRRDIVLRKFEEIKFIYLDYLIDLSIDECELIYESIYKEHKKIIDMIFKDNNALLIDFTSYDIIKNKMKELLNEYNDKIVEIDFLKLLPHLYKYLRTHTVFLSDMSFTNLIERHPLYMVNYAMVGSNMLYKETRTDIRKRLNLIFEKFNFDEMIVSKK